MAPQQSTGTRSANACERCRRRKVKCSGENPCNGCRRHNAPCVFPLNGRNRYTGVQVQELISKVEAYEARLRNLDSSKTASDAPPDNDNGDTLLSPQATVPLSDYLQPPSPALDEQNTSPHGSADSTERARGPAYESRVRYLLGRSQQQAIQNYRPIRDSSSDGRQNTHALALQTPAEPLQRWLENAPRFALPTEAESGRLLELFLFHLGTNQQFFDPRSFVDKVATLYQGPAAREATAKTAWYIEYLLVMATASLMDFNTESAETHRGFDYFAEAMRILPPMHRFDAPDILVVEILMLIAVYLQWRNRKPDAYLYIGYAVRQAIGKGCTLAKPPRGCLPSEEAHRVRVWWTAFMLDRRLSADLGLPSSADDRQFSVPLPRQAPGFPSPEALIINIKIARVTGNIMTYLYNDAEITSPKLVQSIQSYLQELYEIGRSIPLEYSINVTHSYPGVTRTGGSLYLMLYQAIILCARPILLQRVRDKISLPSNSEPIETSMDLMTRLCTTCKQSAINSVRILYGLRRSEMIARFGFFDLEAAFSATLTLIMSAFIDNISLRNMMPELQQAAEVLRYLSDAGNKAAEQRLADLDQFAAHVWVEQSPISSILSHEIDLMNSEDSEMREQQRESGSEAPMGDDTQNINVSRAETVNLGADGAFVPPEQSIFGNDAGFQHGFNFEMYPPPDTNIIFGSFNDPNMPLTGVDELDWAEIERIFIA